MTKNKELELAFNFIEKTDRNLFLTGKAGTGKTTFLHKIKQESLKRIIVVAPTGVAAINAKGVTIHSFFQLPFGPIIPGASQHSSASNQRRFSRMKIDIIKSLDLVIIDEISMVRADVLDGIDSVLRRYKDRTKAFGGVQILMIGDLQQLSPVVRPNEWSLLSSHYKTAYFFSSNAFQQANAISIELKYIYRQQNKVFIDVLNEVRNNKLSQSSADILNKQLNPTFEPQKEDGYITLTTHNRKADAINANEINKLTTKSRTYSAEIYRDFNEKNFPTDENLTLKVGAQVMFIKNDSSPEKRYYNGKIGTIISLEKDTVLVKCSKNDIIETSVETWENIKYNLNKETQEISENLEGSYTQIPLRLAWAITIHKSQGLTFEKAIIDAEASFAHGQTYVALSRCKTLEGIVLKTPIKSSSIINDDTVSFFSKQVKDNEPSEEDLQLSKKQFQLNLITELFNYHSFLQPTNRLIDVFYNNKTSLKGTIIEPLQKIKNQGIIPLLKVANSFKNQIIDLSTKVENLQENQAIQERFKKGCTYFKTQTKTFIKAPLEEIHYTTDNKQVEKDIKKPLQILEEKLAEKLFCFEKLTISFSIENYLKIRAQAVLQEPKKQQKKAVVTSTKHQELFKSLQSFRLDASNTNDIPPFQIFTQKTLFELCELFPQNKIELKKVKGMGKIRVEKYGDEILEIINKYAQENNLKSQIELVEVKKDKRNTKEITFNLFKEGISVEKIAEKRGFVLGTIQGHLAHFIESGELEVSEFISKKKLKKAVKIIKKTAFESLSEIKEILGDEYSYGELRIILSWINSQK